MAIYTLTGSGVQTLTGGTHRVYVDVLTYGPGYSTGRATPTNYFHLGLLRWMYHGASYPVIPIDASTMIIEGPALFEALGYSLEPGTSIQVQED